MNLRNMGPSLTELNEQKRVLAEALVFVMYNALTLRTTPVPGAGTTVVVIAVVMLTVF